MFATKTIIATLALSGALAAHDYTWWDAQPAGQAQQPSETAGEFTVPGTDALAAPTGPTGGLRMRHARPGTIQFGSAVPAAAPAGGGQHVIDDAVDAPLGSDEPETDPVSLYVGQSFTRCGVTVSNLEQSSDAVLLSPADGGCFTSIVIGDGVHASIDVAEGASGLEFLQVTVMGRAFLEVGGEQGLGEYDMREPATCKAGILVDGSGVTASDQEELATIILKSSRNVVQSLGASSGHEIRVEGSSNLVRLSGGDQVLSNGQDTRILWLAPIFLL